MVLARFTVFATGGAHHPLGGQQLVGCLRPGVELVVSPHKTVAELGVIGRAEDMHKIVDAEPSSRKRARSRRVPQ
jgi:hypothetical protein